MAQGYLQTVQQGANNSYQDLVDTAARLGAIQEEYKQRQAALEEQQKAGIRSGASQAAVLGGTLGWQNLKDYYKYVDKTGDWTLGQAATAKGPTVILNDPNAGTTAINKAIGTNFQTGTAAKPYQYGTPLPNTVGNTTIPNSTPPADELAYFYNDAHTYPEVATTPSLQTYQYGTPITPQTAPAGSALPITTNQPPVNVIPQTAEVPAQGVSQAISLNKEPESLFGFKGAPATTESGQVVPGVTAGSEVAAAQTATGAAETAAEAGTAAAEGGALSGAMAGLGGIAGIGLGAYSAAKTGLSVGNVSSMIGGGLMLGSLMEGAAFLGPWGLGVALAGGIASSIFGW